MERERPEEIIARLNRDGASLAARFALRYRAIEAERPRVKRRYGVCYADGTIRIRLRHAATGRPLKYSSLVNTLCHELAHLRHFNHGQRFQRFYRQILEYARAARIYSPGPVDPQQPAIRLGAARREQTPQADALVSVRRRPIQRPTTAPPPRVNGPAQLTLF